MSNLLRRLLTIAAIVVFVSADLMSQFSRTEAMGGLSFSIVDRDQTLSPYDFGGNPAGLHMKEKESSLRMTGYDANSWGNYRRKYDTEGTMNVGASFQQIQQLGDHGTFSGRTSYDFENRRNFYRSLKKDSYGGESFFLADSTAADFEYKGPKVDLLYSWEPIQDLAVGGLVTYQLTDGLKKAFSYAKTVYRNTELLGGLAYTPCEEVVIGGTVKYFDSQESIEASDVNLLDVELFYFRGDNLFVSKRASSMTAKIKKQGMTFGSQFFWKSGNDLSIGVQANYTPADAKILKPYTSSGQTFDEVEESYAAFTYVDAQVQAHYRCTNDLLLGVSAGYFNDQSWSKISDKELLIWKWNVWKFVAGAGGSYQVMPFLLVGVEYELSRSEADSSKYIDARRIQQTSLDHALRAGVESKIADEVFVRAGAGYGVKEHDMVSGGNDCKTYKVTCGAGFPISRVLTIDVNCQYLRIAPAAPVNVSRSFLSGILSFELHDF